MTKAEQTGYPVLLKATGGGGGIGIYTCPDSDAVRKNFAAAGRQAATLSLLCLPVSHPVGASANASKFPRIRSEAEHAPTRCLCDSAPRCT